MVIINKRPGHYQRSVHFELAMDQQAEQVVLVGDFNGWNVNANVMELSPKGKWETTVHLSPGRYIYQFVVDGHKWIADPDGKIADHGDVERSLLNVA